MRSVVAASRCCFPWAPRASLERGGRWLAARSSAPVPSTPASRSSRAAASSSPSRSRPRRPAGHGRLRRQRRLSRDRAGAARASWPSGSRSTRAAAGRVLAGVALPLFAAALVVNQNLTALTCAAGRRRRLCSSLVSAPARRAAAGRPSPLRGARASRRYAPLRHRAAGDRAAPRAGQLGRRSCPSAAVPGPPPSRWRASAADGVRPGHVRRRVRAAPPRGGDRAAPAFVAPLLTSSYAEAHCDYLQVFSDAGVRRPARPRAAALPPRGRSAARPGARGDAEAVILLAVLVAGRPRR